VVEALLLTTAWGIKHRAEQLKSLTTRGQRSIRSRRP
jgi:hypothetical protein